MRRVHVTTPADAVRVINDGADLTVEGSGGGLLEPDALLRELGRRFRDEDGPRGLSLMHCTGIGDRAGGGLDHVAHRGLFRRVVGGNWGMAPQMCRLAIEGAFEAYNLPQGVMAQLYREIAAHRPGLITRVGLDTFVDPRREGGRLNDRTVEDLVELIELDGQPYLRYRPFNIDVCFIRGTTADEYGNLTLEHEGAVLETLAIAQATRNAGGTVIAQVQRMAQGGSLPPREVVVPGILVDVVAVHPDQQQTVNGYHEPAFSGERRVPLASQADMTLDARKVVARRAAREVRAHSVINLGVGMADGVASVLAEEGCLDEVTLTIEQGLVGGMPARGVIFGVSYNPTAFLDQPAQFDFYDGGGLDTAFLGFAQIDADGNVNVSRFGDRLVGAGGFINISSNASTVVFCGRFTAGPPTVEVVEGEGIKLGDGDDAVKFVDCVDQVTFSGRAARQRGQRVLYVTERAVFELGAQGLELVEVAPGIDPERDVVDRLPFAVGHDAPKWMDRSLFSAQPMGLTLEAEPADPRGDHTTASRPAGSTESREARQ